jgi:hypothetical protein
MKNSIIYFLLLAFITSSCNKQLNVLPTTTKVDGNVIVDRNSAQVALNGVYYRFANGGVDNNNVPTILWERVNESIPAQLAGLEGDASSTAPLSLHGYNALSAFVDVPWSYGYALINAANGFISNLQAAKNIPDTAVRRMNGEALFLRAFGNSRLLFTYGHYRDVTSKYGIILRTQFVDATAVNLPRSTVADAYTSILKDLDSAIAGLPNRNTSVIYGNVWCAKLLKARVLMNRGDYAEVISLTTDVISNSGFALETNTKDIFLKNGFSSTEVMLGAQPFPAQSQKYSEYIYYVQNPVTPLLADLFNGDPRSSWMIQTVTTGSGGQSLGVTKYYPGDVINTAPLPITENVYAFRLTEAYLLKAEALILSGGSVADAKTLLETVLGHAGITDFSSIENEDNTDSLHLMIVKEFMKNFVAEDGQEWDAVRRLPFATLQQLLPSVSAENQLALPVPNDEIIRNNLMVQNPGY